MGVLSVTFSDTARLRLGLSLAIINWVCVSSSLMVTMIGVYIQLSVEEYVNLIKDYNHKVLPIMLMSVGGISAMVNGFGGLLCFMGCKVDGAKKLKMVFLPYTIFTAIVCICIFAGGMACFSHIAHLKEAFHGGLKAAMGKYRDVKHIKTEFDWLQMTYECCGSEAYTDWFHTSWINEEYLNVESESVKKKMEKGAYLSDDAPFSCCSPATHRPCIHHSIHDNGAHWNYDYRTQTTLYGRGCKAALMEFFGGQLLTNSGALITGIFLLQVIVLIGVRYLQSAMVTALESDTPWMPSKGCLFDCEKIGKKDAPLPEEEKLLADKKKEIGEPEPIGDETNAGESEMSFGSFDDEPLDPAPETQEVENEPVYDQVYDPEAALEEPIYANDPAYYEQQDYQDDQAYNGLYDAA